MIAKHIAPIYQFYFDPELKTDIKAITLEKGKALLKFTYLNDVQEFYSVEEIYEIRKAIKEWNEC